MVVSSTQELLDRVERLEGAYFECPDGVQVSEQMRRARNAVESTSKLYSARWKWVPPDYYTWSLSERAVCLGASSPDYLCKSLLMENKKVKESDSSKSDPTNPKFVMVVIQYGATLDMRKLVTSIRALRPVKMRLEDNQYDFRIASAEDNDKITGYTHNSVTPFGLLRPGIPILLCQAIVPLKHFWMGGGHVHLKLGMPVADFCAAVNPIIADVSQPRSGTTDTADLD